MARSIEFSLSSRWSRPQPTLQIELLISIVKFDRFEWCLEKAAELGVSRNYSSGSSAEREEIAGRGGEAVRAMGENPIRFGAAIAAIEAAGRCSCDDVLKRRLRIRGRVASFLLSERQDARPVRSVQMGCSEQIDCGGDWAGGRMDGWGVSLGADAGFYETSLGEGSVCGRRRR